MRITLIAVFLLATTFGDARGQEKSPTPSKRPDHLVPLDPFPAPWRTKYENLYRKTLDVPEEPAAAVMIWSPSFQPEECLVLHESGGERTTFKLIHTRADRNVWYSMAENNEDGKPSAVKTIRSEASLPPELAQRACRAWDRMLRRVRYPAPDNENLIIVDGVRIEFRRYRMVGETRSPSGGCLERFVDLGKRLMDFCDASEAGRAAATAEVEKALRALEKDLDR